MTYRETILQGRIPQNLDIIDAHTHVIEGETADNYVYNISVERWIEFACKLGICKLFASHNRALNQDVQAGNDRLFALCEKYAGTLYAYYYYCPHFHEACMRDLELRRKHPAFVGIKLHPACDNVYLSSGRYDELFDCAQRYRLPVLCHTWEPHPQSDVAQFRRILKKYPNLFLILGHMGGLPNSIDTSIRLSMEYAHVYLDINGSHYSRLWIEKLAERAGVQKLIFGTDQCFNDPRIVLGRVLLSELEDKCKQAILGGNIRSLLRQTAIQFH